MDFAKLGEYGVGLGAIVVLYYTIKLILDSFKTTQKATNAVIQSNTKAINSLTITLEKSNIIEEQFRSVMRDDVRDVKGMVREIHEKVVH